MKTTVVNVLKKIKKEMRIPFGLKLTFIVTLILLGSIWIITALMALLVRSEFIRTTEETNFAINSRAAAGTEERLYKIRSEGLLLLDMSAAAENSSSMTTQIRNIFFERNPYIGAVIVPGGKEIINRSFFTNNEIPQDAINAWLVKESDTIERAKAGEPVLRNATPALGIYLLALFYPWQNSGYEEAAVIFFSPQNLLEITGSGSNTTVVVNEEGDVLISPDYNQVLGGENISTNALFEALWKDLGESVRLSYTVDGNRYVGAGHRVSLANAAVFTSLEYSIITEQITAATRRNILLSVTVMFLTILVTWYYSRIVTGPLKKLMAAAGQIEKGEFNPVLKIESRDELGALADRFIAMGQGLSRWENARNLVGRYNNQEITDRAMNGKLALKGEYFKAVVLSVDMASFYTVPENNASENNVTGASETKPEAAELSLDHLNFLVSAVADNVEKTGGVVDSITGARLIALWGVPLSSGDIAAELMNSLQSILMLRNQLWELNTDQESKGKPLYKVHCGIHTGEVLAGRIGSSRYSQYTVAGKTIDGAVKAGEACEHAKIDIVITKDARDLVKNLIIAEKIDHPKGYDSSLQFFGLVNLVPAEGKEKQRWPFTLKDVQESLGGGKSR